MTCRCLMCGMKDSNSNHVRREYLILGIKYSEDMREFRAEKKAQRRRARHVAKRIWKAQI